MTGPKVSTTKIVWVAVVVVPHKLVNENDRVMISSPHSGSCSFLVFVRQLAIAVLGLLQHERLRIGT